MAHLVLCLGQSNAMNFGTLGLPFPGGWVADSFIQIWNGFKVTPGYETYTPNVNSGGMDSVGGCWGPEAEFARLWRLRHPLRTLYIYKQALGGTGDGVAAKGPGILDWSPTSSPLDPFKQYPRMVTGVIAAANALGALTGETVDLDTLLWCGNETDTVLQADALACQVNTQQLIVSIRAAFSRPKMRCVLSRVFPNATQGPYINIVRAAQEAVAGFGNAFINMDDLIESIPRPGHLVPDSVVIQGARMFDSDWALRATIAARIYNQGGSFNRDHFAANAFDLGYGGDQYGVGHMLEEIELRRQSENRGKPRRVTPSPIIRTSRPRFKPL